MLVGGVLASTGYALAPVSTADKMLYIALDPGGRRSRPSANLDKYPYLMPHRLVEVAAESSARCSGPATRATRASPPIGADYAFGYE